MWQRLFGIKVITLLGLVLLALLAFTLSAFAISSYQQLAREGLQQSTRELLRLRSQQHVQQLYDKQKYFAYRLQTEQSFRQALQQGNYEDLQALLQPTFERMRSRSDGMHLRSILIRDLNGEVLAASHQQDTSVYNGCPLIIDRVRSASGTQRLKAKYALCQDRNMPMTEVVVSIGSLKPRAYLHVIAHLKDEFVGLHSELRMPMKLQNVDQEVLFVSPAWEDPEGRDPDYLPVSYTLYGDDNIPGIVMTALKDVSQFNHQDAQANFKIMTVVIASVLSLLLLLGLLLFHTFKAVETIRKSAGIRLNGRYAPIGATQLPHELQEIVSAYNVMVIEQEDAAQKQQEAELLLRRERDFISTTLDSITNAVIVIDAHMRIRLANPAAEALLDDSEETLKNYALDELVIMYTNRSATHIANLKQLLKTPYQLINLFFQRDDMTIELEMMASPMVDKETEEVGHVLIFKDVTEDRKLRRKLHFEGLHDPLTGLLNRRAFEHRYDAMINEAEVTRTQHIMVYINLDQFQMVNDTGGSEAGDELLKKVAKTIQERVRKSDTLARLGSDEYGILFPYARTDAAEKTVNEILNLIVQQGFHWEDREFHITASASFIAFGHSNDQFPDMYQQLVDASRQAKDNGGNQCIPV